MIRFFNNLKSGIAMSKISYNNFHPTNKILFILRFADAFQFNAIFRRIDDYSGKTGRREREKEREALTYNMESLVEHANPLAYHDAHDVRLLPLLLHCEHVLHWSQDPIQSHDGQA